MNVLVFMKNVDYEPGEILGVFFPNDALGKNILKKTKEKEFEIGSQELAELIKEQYLNMGWGSLSLEKFQLK